MAYIPRSHTELEAELAVETRKPTIQEQIQWCREGIAREQGWVNHFASLGQPEKAQLSRDFIERESIRLDKLELALAWDITPLPDIEMPVIDWDKIEEIPYDHIP
jgi:hypothetical protein